jgi:tyrosyl-tRNA synthetase
MKVKKEEVIQEALSKSVDTIIPSREALASVMMSDKKLTMYWGIDPTGPDLHIEHAVNLFILRRFQKLGHKIVVLFGDFTAQIGDPTGKDKKRVPLTKEQVRDNVKNYKEQVLKILDREKTEFRRNSEWWGKKSAQELLELADTVTYQRVIERDMFQKRIKEGKPISMKELFYPLLQGYDTVALGADVELGGSDQLFNMMMGRDFARTLENREKFVITKPLLAHPETGNMLMSKTSGRYIALTDKPDDMYGKIMALPDEVVISCFRLCADADKDDVKNLEQRLMNGENPRNVKMKLAHELVVLYWGKGKADVAEERFVKQFQKHGIPDNIPEEGIQKNEDIVSFLTRTGLTESKSEARRLLLQGAVEFENIVIKDPLFILEKRGILRVGKKKLVRIS